MARRQAKTQSALQLGGGGITLPVPDQEGSRASEVAAAPWWGNLSAPMGIGSLERYRTLAASYDWFTEAFQSLRRDVVDVLNARSGDVVLDVGCGTGLCLSYLEEKVGSQGFLVGIDQSPEMLAQAHERVRASGWNNVILIESPAEEAESPLEGDGALFCATHDILRSPLALKNVISQLRPGAPVVADVLQNLQVTTVAFGTGYVAAGTTPA